MNPVREAWFGILWFFDLPRAKRIDPTEFPEDGFPAWCMRCGYELRGLPENRCPECGTPFDRGELLVLEYVRFKRALTNRRYALGVLLGRTAVATAITWMLAIPVLGLCIQFVDPRAIIAGGLDDYIAYVAFGLIGLQALIGVCGVASTLLLSASLPTCVRKGRRAVLRAALRESRRLREALYYAGRKEPHA